MGFAPSRHDWTISSFGGERKRNKQKRHLFCTALALPNVESGLTNVMLQPGAQRGRGKAAI